ncbi:MAG: hypothetical protein HW373_1072 [Deltaproteobacteria bacterium]|nr:hypothetical protein [Deltaproteobacteria bacterium]
MNEEGPSLLSRSLWTKRTARFLAILERALQLLGCQTALGSAEVALNRRLYWCLLEASRGLYPAEDCAPSPECNNQPDPDDQVRAKREDKRPDFQWIFLDRYESDLHRSSKQFVVECKRLGVPQRADWILNANYIEHGVWRFVAPEWSYAKRFPSAAMVGYWQSMQADDVLREVNAAAGKRGVSTLKLQREGWPTRGVSKLEHRFNRPFPVSPFFLRHFWVDLRT